jgi:hypothetical protein
MFNGIIRTCLMASCLFALTPRQTEVNRQTQTPAAGAKSSQSDAGHSIIQPLPFKRGEVLTYNIGFSKLVFSGSIGQLKLTVRNGQTTGGVDQGKASGSATTLRDGTSSKDPKDTAKPEEPAKDASPKNSKDAVKPEGPVSDASGTGGNAEQPATIEFGAGVVSKGFFTWLFGIKIEDSYGAVVSSEDLGLLRSWKEIDQGDLHRRYETKVNREQSTVSYSETDRNKPGPATVKTGACPRWVLDLLSAVYFIRTQEFKFGSPITIPLTDVGQVYQIDVVPVKAEEVEVEAGKFKSIQLDLKIFDGKYVKRSGQLLVWLSDDRRRLPVRARLKSSGTTVNITLARLEQLS